jgi:type I restriction enzyme S subunit
MGMSKEAVQVSEGTLRGRARVDPHEVPTGYKRTQLGVIPAEWDHRPLRDDVSLISGHHVLAQHCNTQGIGTPYLTGPADFANGRIEQTKYTVRPTTLCAAGDILVTVKGSGSGTLIEADAEYCISRQLMAIRVSRWDERFLYYSLVQNAASIRAASTGLIPGLSRRDIFEQQLPIPRHRIEQHAIAEALSDADRLLGALEALLAKKRAIKQAVMQQLLTGRTRLPGFSSDWEVHRVGALLAYERPDGYIVKGTEYSDHGDIPVLTANKSFVLGYTIETFDVCEDLPVIVFDDFTTDSKFATSPFKVKSSAIKLLRPRHDRVSLRFVFERMQLIRFPVGDHKRYYLSEYQNIRLPFPDYDEQLAVVSVLSDLDAEIAALEARRDKIRAIKQGMMQQLLTGRVRLVTPSSAKSNK